MSESVVNSDGMDVLSSIRRLVGEIKDQNMLEAKPDDSDMLVLTPQLRVGDTGVLRLMPENAVASPEEWIEFEEPPLAGSEAPEEGSVDDASASPPADNAGTQKAVFTPEQGHLALSARITALETAIAKTEDQWEPDGTGLDAYSGTEAPAMTWHDNVDLDGKGTPVQTPSAAVSEPAAASPTRNADEDDLHEDVIDEETLKAMVTQIVRSELQGELGERITRNVRKLVRRELQRALTARSLDFE